MSQITANRMVRMLQGKPLKFTARIRKKDGAEVEIQCPNVPKLEFDSNARSLFLTCKATTEYGSEYPIMAWDDVDILIVEENVA